MTNHFRFFVAIALCLAVTSCGGGDDEASNNETTSSFAFDTLQSLLLPKAPEGAITITEARKNPTPGTKVIVSGKVMGNDNPIIQSRALLTLGDPTRLDSCDLKPGDECPTPWDVCCADPDVVRASIATIQVIDENGKPVKAGLRGIGGLQELSKLIVIGEVADGSNANNFLVNATGIHVIASKSAGSNTTKK